MIGLFVGGYILIGIIYVVILEFKFNAFEEAIERTTGEEYDGDNLPLMFFKGLLQFMFMLNWPIAILLMAVYAIYVVNERKSPT